MTKKTEYLITQYASNGAIIRQIRAPKGVNLRLFLERLICQSLDQDDLLRSCLRSNAKRFYDPFSIMDMRDEHRRDQARAAIDATLSSNEIVEIYNSAREAPIPLEKTLLVAGIHHDYHVKEVAV